MDFATTTMDLHECFKVKVVQKLVINKVIIALVDEQAKH
jgi:hypothetical protein